MALVTLASEVGATHSRNEAHQGDLKQVYGDLAVLVWYSQHRPARHHWVEVAEDRVASRELTVVAAVADDSDRQHHLDVAQRLWQHVLARAESAVVASAEETAAK